MDMNNEMDELFRKAGEDYPLNLGKPDWDAVAGKLHTDTGGLGPGFGLAATAPRKRRRYLWLLLLLLPLGIYGLMRLTGASADGQLADSRRQTADGKTAGTVATGLKPSSLNGKPVDKNKPEATDRATMNKTAETGMKNSGKNGKAFTGNVPGIVDTDNDNRSAGSGLTGNGSPNLPKPTASAGSPGTAGSTTDSSAVTAAAENGMEGNSSPLAEIVMTDKARGKGADSLKNATSTNGTAENKDSAKDKKSVIHPSVKQQRGLYAGITAAPDFSTVKFQTMKSTGYSFGVVAGYRLNSHWSVETGLSWERKKYYSKGEYFDKSKTKIPSTVKVTYIDGYCDMFEIPLTLRYDLTSGKKGHWFAAAGFSSYLMKNENYLYGAESNNVAWSKYVDYKNSGSNFFSILQLSAGYEYNWSSRNRIRVEPYFKAPVSGVGIGSLPITSVGMTFGFVHSFR